MTLTQQLNSVREIRKIMNEQRTGSGDWSLLVGKCVNILLADLELRLQQEINADVDPTNRH